MSLLLCNSSGLCTTTFCQFAQTTNVFFKHSKQIGQPRWLWVHRQSLPQFVCSDHLCFYLPRFISSWGGWVGFTVVLDSRPALIPPAREYGKPPKLQLTADETKERSKDLSWQFTFFSLDSQLSFVLLQCVCMESLAQHFGRFQCVRTECTFWTCPISQLSQREKVSMRVHRF